MFASINWRKFGWKNLPFAHSVGYYKSCCSLFTRCHVNKQYTITLVKMPPEFEHADNVSKNANLD
jgi:hypothetical protein